MREPSKAIRPLRRATRAAWAALLLAACGGGPGPDATPTSATESEWRALATTRPTPLPGAARLGLAEVELLGQPAWPSGSRVSARLGVTELVAAGLLRRADVRFVERRRFAAAADAERAGAARPPGAPAAGVSPGAELTATVTWVALGTGGASLEVRLSETATGRVAGTSRAVVPVDAEPIALARAAVATILATLRELGRLPTWNDPVAGAAPAAYVASGVPPAALADFVGGLAAEEAWRWESARVGYQAAARAPGFFEAEAALARTARLRLGGTLGES
jgi:hypothetical protein